MSIPLPFPWRLTARLVIQWFFVYPALCARLSPAPALFPPTVPFAGTVTATVNARNTQAAFRPCARLASPSAAGQLSRTPCVSLSPTRFFSCPYRPLRVNLEYRSSSSDITASDGNETGNTLPVVAAFCSPAPLRLVRLFLGAATAAPLFRIAVCKGIPCSVP